MFLLTSTSENILQGYLYLCLISKVQQTL